MHKEPTLWSIKELRGQFARISFPEYQREPNVWSRSAKQRLVDSIARQFDIASIYLYKDEDGSLDCIDGRQRLGAIMAFLGQNPDDDDNGFEYKRMNEIYDDEDVPFVDLEGETFAEITRRAETGNEPSRHFIDAILDYEVSVVSLSGSRRPEEFNLQFTRLNVGTIINSGEKLHAMVGALRDVCFKDLGKHPFLQAVGIPTRRYAQEQVAAQILAQVFSVAAGAGYTRTRHFDLQRLFKEHTDLQEAQRAHIERVRQIMDLLHEVLEDPAVLKNRALTVSAVLMAWELDIRDTKGASQLARFLVEFLCRLKWQLAQGLDFDPAYRPLIDFQRYVTQASVEKPAVERRAAFLMDQHEYWKRTGQIKGDEDYKGDPSRECRESS